MVKITGCEADPAFRNAPFSEPDIWMVLALALPGYRRPDPERVITGLADQARRGR